VGDKGQGPRHRPLAELALRQHGVVATRQLAELGYGRNSVSKACKAGRLHRIHRGVYAVGYRRLTWHGRCMAAVLASYPSVASHLSAGWLWGLLRSRPGTVHVTSPTARRAKRSFEVHAADLVSADRTVRDGIPVTSLSRTVLDLSSTRTVSEVQRLIQRANDEKVFDLREMNALLARGNGHHAAPKVRAALDLYVERPAFTRSDLERRFLDLVTAAGLAPPSMNRFVAGYELDAYWEAERFGVELDVYATHGSPLSFEEDRIRDDELAHDGVLTIRVTGARLDREPAAVVDSVRRHLARRARIK
jgi:predicted transcriptional regulator of viral defense system